MCMTDEGGRAIWQRGGRVEKLPLKFEGKDTDKDTDASTPVGALKEAAKNLRGAAESFRNSANSLNQRAQEKEAQAAEIDEAVKKLEGGA